MRCPYCDALEDKVVDSRVADEGRAIRRRRECLECGRRYTTFERAEDVPIVVVKRAGAEEPFDRDKIIEGLRRATKNRPVTDAEIEAITEDVEDTLRVAGKRRLPSADIGKEVLDRLAKLDEVAYVRFASVYKDFQELTDFEKELGIMRPPPRNGES